MICLLFTSVSSFNLCLFKGDSKLRITVFYHQGSIIKFKSLSNWFQMASALNHLWMGHWTLMHSNCSMISIRLVQSQTSLNGQIWVIIEHWRVTGLTIFIKQMPSTLHWECLFASVSFEFIITLNFFTHKASFRLGVYLHSWSTLPYACAGVVPPPGRNVEVK